jgi:uncharacterized Zn finger protein
MDSNDGYSTEPRLGPAAPVNGTGTASVTVVDRRAEWSKPGYKPDRLARAWQHVKSGRVERLGGTQFKVAGNVEPVYYVDLASDQPCTCLDRYHREAEIQGMCKHILACRLASLDEGLLQVIGDALLRAEQAVAELTKRTRRRKSTSV